jgi:hypothetical protein
MTKKAKFQEESMLSKSVQPILIGITLLVVAYVGYKVYVACQNAMRCVSLALIVVWLGRLLIEGLLRNI